LSGSAKTREQSREKEKNQGEERIDASLTKRRDEQTESFSGETLPF
jgi:hypothetical protein